MRIHAALGMLGLVSLLCGSAAGDTLGLYGDPTGTNCNIVPLVSMMTSVYVIHTSPQGATAAEFKAPKPACWTGGVYLSDQSPFPCLIGCGDSQTGRSIGYGSCQSGSFLITTIQYFNISPSGSCCPYPLLPHPNSGERGVEVMDCSFTVVTAEGLVSTVNGGTACPCGYAVANEETTWGKMKALYAEAVD